VPFLRARLARWGLPPLPARKLLDTCALARNKLRLGNFSLERVVSHLGVSTKQGVEPILWQRAALDGDRRATSAIVKHRERDVRLLARVVERRKGSSAAFNGHGSAW